MSSRDSSTPAPSGRARILVVEDERDIAELFKHTFERSGDAQVEIALGGHQALRRVTEAPPDLILLDLNLPVLDGMEVCRLLRGAAHAGGADHHRDRARGRG